jgi:phosphoribosylanthranilate isomerase
MTWVKVCGITDVLARDAAIDAGADALGFVIDPDSPRFLGREVIADLISGVAIETFIVSVDVPAVDLLEIAREVGATGIQAHGRGAGRAAIEGVAFGLRVLRPVPVHGGVRTIDDTDIPRGAIPLFDTGRPDVHGGTGTTFPWDVVADVDRDFVLAGGLGPDNVAEAVRRVRPWGVDASSRLEARPGVKDPDSIRDFVREAKRT